MATKAAAKAEALGNYTEVEYDGETYSVPPTMEWDLDVLEALEDGQIVKAVRSLLGEEQYTKFKFKKRTVADLNELFEEIGKAAGFSGN